jgi:hypothetical protein
MNYKNYNKHLFVISFFLMFTLSFFSILSCNSRESKISSLSSNYSGCFGSGEEKIVIYKTDSATIARFKKNDKVESSVIINSSQLDTFGKYIDNLNNLRSGCCCTTIIQYNAEYKGKSIKKTDNGCNWNGFDHLKNYLFPSE